MTVQADVEAGRVTDYKMYWNQFIKIIKYIGLANPSL